MKRSRLGLRGLPPSGFRRRTGPRWYTAAPIVLLASFFVFAGLAEAVPRIVHADTAITSLGLADILFDPPIPPTPSGVDPAYPLNHTIDGDPTTLGQPQNADFETPPSSVGTPPSNSDIETAPVDVVSVPNGDFETGTFANWTLTGSPTIQSDAPHGYWARMGSNGQEITSSALVIPSTAQSLLADVYFQGNNSWWEVYALTGPTFGTSTQLVSEYCPNCGWQLRYVDLTAYQGQTIKLRFKARFNPVGIDNVKVQQVFPGFISSGVHARRVDGSDHYASLGAGSWIATDAFTLDETAQSGTVEIKGAAANSQYSIKIATGPSFGTWSTLSSGVAPSGWEAKTFNIAPYAGQQVKVKVTSEYNVTYFDEILGSQTTDIPGWTPTGGTSRITEGTNHYVLNGDTLTSAPVQIPDGAQNATFRMRSSGAGTGMTIDLLYGSGYSQTQQLDFFMVPADWTTIKVGVAPYAGQTVKLRFTKSLANPAYYLDDAGIFEKVLNGWTPTSLHPLEVGQDAHGTFATGYGDEPLFEASSWVAPGVIDRPGIDDARYYAFSYDLTQGGLTQLFWNDEQGGSANVFQYASGSPTGYRTSWIKIPGFLGTRGRLGVKLPEGGKLYSLGDNVARESLTEPFSRKVGAGIDTTTGSVTFAETDLSVPGSFPLAFTRTYNAHSDVLGPMGFRWTHTYDTHLVFAEDDVGVLFGSGREEFFDEFQGTYTAVDARVHSALVEHPGGTFTLTTKDNLDYDFTAAGVLTQISDLNGNALDLAYDGQGRLSTVTGEGGVALTLGYDGNGRLTTLTDPAGSQFSYAYDANGDLITVTDPEEGVRTYTYSRHLLASVTDQEGHLVVDNAYDDVNRITAQTDADDRTIGIAYDTPDKGATEVTFPDAGVSGFYFDGYHRTSTTVDPTGRQTTFVYDDLGNLDKIVDSGSNEWDYAFDATGDLTGATDPLGNPASFDYNAKHLPVSVTDARGNETTFTYDADGNLLTSTDPLDGVTTNTYDAAGNLLTSTDPLDRTTTYTYNAKGLQTSKTNALGKTWTSTYTPLGKLATETDPLGNTTTYGYDLLGRLTWITDALDRETSYVYDLVGHLLMVEDPAGNQTTWDYDDRGLVEAKTDPAGKTTTYTYDEARRMTSMTNAEGETTSYGYDDGGRLASITDPLDNATTYAYDDEGRLGLKTEPLGRETAYAYDEAGRLATLTQPNGATVTYAYDADGNLTSTTDELDRVTTSAYDELSRLVSSTDPLGNVTTYGFDAAGQMTSTTDPLDNQTTYGYDDAGQMTSVSDPLGHETRYGFDDAGRRVSVTDPTDRTTAYGYDDAGQLTSVTDPGGNTTSNAYGLAGTLTSVTTPEGHETTYAYDPHGLLTSVTDPLDRVTSYTYDDAGRMLTETDPTGAVTTYGYDAAGRMTSLTDDLGGVVGFGYNDAGQQTSLTDPNGNTWTYTYNALGLRTQVTDPLDRDTVFAYDDAGQLISHTDGREITTSYGYDDAGQQTSETFPGGSVSHAYDDAGRRTQMVDVTGTTSFAYDDAGRTMQVASPEGTIAYAYDAAGRRTSMTLPGSRSVTYAYNQTGRLGSLTDWLDQTTTFGYDDDGNRTEISRPSGVVTTTTYDAGGQVTDISHTKGSNELLGFTYTYDDAGRPSSLVSGEGAETYAYDDLGRLTSVSYPDGLDVSYTYDPAGNRLTETRDGQTTNYAYDDASELASVGGASYSYDDAGNLIQAGSDSYSWDHDSRLLSADVGAQSATYAYDGDGIRVESEVDSATSTFLVDRAGGLPRIVDDGTTAYLQEDGFLETLTGQQSAYALVDDLNSIRSRVSDLGVVESSTSYEVFGALRTETGVRGLHGFTGEPTDSTGLVFLRARSLDPRTGSMLSADELIPNGVGTQGFNEYTYVANNPTTWTDSTGHMADDVVDRINTSLEDFMRTINAPAYLLAAVPLTVPAPVPLWPVVLVLLAIAAILLVLFVADLLSKPNVGEGSRGGQATHDEDVRHAPWGYPDDITDPAPVPPIAPPSIGWDQPDEGQLVYRVWGGREAPEWRMSWTPEDPRIYGPEKYRAAAGLPDRLNAGTMLTIARIRDPGAVVDARLSRPMTPPDSYCVYSHPTLFEYVIRDSAAALERVAALPLSPPYGGPPRSGCP